MPLWQIYHPENAFTDEQKESLAGVITEDNHRFVGIPRFYVNVFFHETKYMYIGGKRTTNFIRITTDTIARAMPTPEIRAQAMAGTEAFLAPFIKERGFDWEIHFDETPRDLWRVQGLIPPESFSDAEKMWLEENRPVPYYDVDPIVPFAG
ncbi:tautomerase family protein [Streptomyces sp. NBC_00631]|uniref:tautomerase family protein n=1 Tax=Streptomyces sp. NBC_00631 TaxID=2975793 RepID=UPI0030DFDB23